jgi:Mrp family chromosome partitioning ATPase
MSSQESKSALTPNAALRRASEERAIRETLARIKHTYLILSGKGGVGKSTVAVNLAVALSRRNLSVGLLDIDLHGPDVARMLGLRGTLAVDHDKKMVPFPYSASLKLVSIEHMLRETEKAVIWRGPLKRRAIRKFISDVQWGDLDYLIVDAPPGTGDEPLAVAKTIPDVSAILVTTPTEVAQDNVRRAIRFCRKTRLAIFGLIENMRGLKCPYCGGAVALFGSGGSRKIATEAGISFLGSIPFDPNVVVNSDAGCAYLEDDPNSTTASVFTRIVDRIISCR